MPYLTGENGSAPHEALFWRSHHMKAARWQQWKLLVDDREDRTWLYDLSVDKEEQTNVAGTHAEVVNEMTKRLNAWEAELAPARWPYLVEYRFEIGGEVFDYPL